MTERTPNSVLRRVRDMLRRGDNRTDIAAACSVELHIVIRQRALMTMDGNALHAMPRATQARTTGLKMQRETDAYDVDLVDIFATPRTPRQIRRAMNGTGE